MEKPEPKTIQCYEAAEVLKYFICSADSDPDFLHFLKRYLEAACSHRSYAHFSLRPKAIIDNPNCHHRAVLQFANFTLSEFDLYDGQLHMWSWNCDY